MTDLSDPAIREAGARALYVHRIHPGFLLFDPLNADEIVQERQRWTITAEHIRERCREAWDRIATELNPIIQMVEIREQLRAGDDPGSEPDNTNPDPASPDNAVQEGEE